MDGVQPTPTPQELLERASQTAENWEKSAKTFEASVAARRAEIERGFSAVPDPRERTRLTKEHSDQAEADLRRAEVLLNKDFHQRRRDLIELERAVDSMAARHADDVAAVDSATLASPKRSVYSTNLAGAGLAGLTRVAQQAIDTRDAELAAAVILRLQSLPVKDRPVSVRDVAKAVLPQSVIEAREKLATARKAVARAVKATWAFQKPAGHERIKHGLKYGEPLPRGEAE